MSESKEEKKVELEKRTVEVISKIVVDGEDYPLHKWNLDVIARWEATGDDSVLDSLKDFALEF